MVSGESVKLSRICVLLRVNSLLNLKYELLAEIQDADDTKFAHVLI